MCSDEPWGLCDRPFSLLPSTLKIFLPALCDRYPVRYNQDHEPRSRQVPILAVTVNLSPPPFTPIREKMPSEGILMPTSTRVFFPLEPVYSFASPSQISPSFNSVDSGRAR